MARMNYPYMKEESMKSLLLLWNKLANESASWCGTCARLDIKTVKTRVEHEGVSFLTITLSNFGSDFQKSLDQGFVGSGQFAGFQRSGGLPIFLSGFLRLVFDKASGRLLSNPSIEAIRSVRQLTLMFGKVLLPCTPARERKAIDRYVQCEREVQRYDETRSLSDLESFTRIGSLLFGEVLQDLESRLFCGDLRSFLPKHGPGATSDRLRGNSKFDLQTWHRRLETILPAGDGFLLPNWRYHSELKSVDFSEPGREDPVRVHLVPKSLKTPRIIAIEPTCMQYAQQAILTALLLKWRGSDIPRRFITFNDQEPNRFLSAEGSRTGNLATLDLSEASDRVSNQLVRALFSRTPLLAEAIDATRTRRADVPGVGVLRLAKYASMGSALCFPVEAMVFLTVIFTSIEKELKRPLTVKDIKSFDGAVRVFGDDIIVPTTYVLSVIRDLEAFGFKVNSDKSFWTGKFRESCGRESYDGHDVSITRVRRIFPPDRRNAAEDPAFAHFTDREIGSWDERVVGLVSLRNQLYFSGYWDTCRWLDEQVTTKIRHFPPAHPTSAVIGRHTVLDITQMPVQRLSRYQTPLVKGYVIEAKSPVSKITEGYRALLKCLTLMESRDLLGLGILEESERLAHLTTYQSQDRWWEALQNGMDHLERSGRPSAVHIKLKKEITLF